MKKLFFYTNAKIYDEAAGITKKVKSQVRAFEKLGYEVEYSVYTEDGVAILQGNGKKVCEISYSSKNKRVQRYLRRNDIIKFVTKYIEKNKYDIIYLRYHFFDKVYLKLLKQARKNGLKVVIEAHSYPCIDKNSIIMFPVYVQDKIWEKNVCKYIDLTAAMCEFDELWKKPTVKICNAVDLDEINMHRPINHNLDEINLIMVAYESKVHGVDRILKGIDQYKKNGGKKKIIIHFVGTYLDSTVSLAKNSEYSSNYIFYGKLTGQALDDVYNKADIGIGSLANHRVGSYTGSSLKTIEYMAKGLPFIYGWREKIIDDTFPYAKRFELCEEEIDIFELEKFYEYICKVDSIQKKMRDYLGEEGTWVGQLRKVIDFCEREGV